MTTRNPSTRLAAMARAARSDARRAFLVSLAEETAERRRRAS